MATSTVYMVDDSLHLKVYAICTVLQGTTLNQLYMQQQRHYRIVTNGSGPNGTFLATLQGHKTLTGVASTLWRCSCTNGLYTFNLNKSKMTDEC